MTGNRNKKTLLNRVLREVIETAFIIFLFYSNLLMGEYNQTGRARGKGIGWALGDIFTTINFAIAIVTAIIGHFIFQFLRKRF